MYTQIQAAKMKALLDTIWVEMEEGKAILRERTKDYLCDVLFEVEEDYQRRQRIGGQDD